MSAKDHIVISSGYEGLAVKEYVERLSEHGVSTVVDVRLTPISRKKGFSKTALTEALAAEGINYVHERELGNPKDNRDEFRKGKPAARRRYVKHLLNGATPRFEAVCALAAAQTIALLCFEADHSSCHRSCITDRMLEEHPELRVEMF